MFIGSRASKLFNVIRSHYHSLAMKELLPRPCTHHGCR